MSLNNMAFMLPLCALLCVWWLHNCCLCHVDNAHNTGHQTYQADSQSYLLVQTFLKILYFCNMIVHNLVDR
jgi:hypothetical protein